MPRDYDPYASYKVKFKLEGETVAGFTEVSGLETGSGKDKYREIYQDKDDNTPAGPKKVSNITLKRGITRSSSFTNWIKKALDGYAEEREGVIVVEDEADQRPIRWALSKGRPAKYTGPSLGGKGGGDVSMEELTITAEKIEIIVE